jgi:hypothetical protein
MVGLDGASRQFATVTRALDLSQVRSQAGQSHLWHCCGQYTLETLVAGAAPGVLELARKYVVMLHLLGDVQVIAQKSRLVAWPGCGSPACPHARAALRGSFALRR